MRGPGGPTPHPRHKLGECVVVYTYEGAEAPSVRVFPRRERVRHWLAARGWQQRRLTCRSEKRGPPTYPRRTAPLDNI